MQIKDIRDELASRYNMSDMNEFDREQKSYHVDSNDSSIFRRLIDLIFKIQEKQWSNIAGLKIEHDHEGGEYVRLINGGGEVSGFKFSNYRPTFLTFELGQEMALGGFTLLEEASGHKVKYAFSARQKLPANTTLTVCSILRQGIAYLL